jgi:low affinity Fe/Cu permease
MLTKLVNTLSDHLTRWIGSTTSLIVHTFLFILAFASHWLFGWPFDFILLILTTAVSLEAIYLAIFIQRSVNQQAERLEDVEESLDDVEKAVDDVEEALDDVEEALDDVEEGLDDVEKNTAKPKKRASGKITQEDLIRLSSELETSLRDIQDILSKLPKDPQA